MNNGRKQHFLEVYLPNLSSQRLKIPSNFIKHLTGRISGFVSLMGPSGNSWHVHLVEITGNLYFDDGWKAFVRDHSIEYGDSLVFGYDGNMSFTVQIFDQTSCEKEEAYYCKCSQQLSDLSQNLANKRKSGGEAAFSSAFGEKRMRVSWIPTYEDFEVGEDLRLKTSSSEGQEHEESYDTDDSFEASEMPFLLALPAEENSQMLIPSMNKRKKRKMVSLETFNKTRMILRRNKNAPGLMKAHSKKKKVHTRIKFSIYKKIEERAAQRFTSGFPYFVRFMNYSSVVHSSLNVPVCFSVKHFRHSRFKVTLRNLGRYWVVDVARTRHKYSIIHRFSSGWRNFIRDNRIKENDICIFELVSKYEMVVHISRTGLKGIGNGTHKCSFDNFGFGDDVGSDNNVHLSRNLVDVNKLSIHDNEGHKGVSEMTPRPHQVTISSNYTSGDTRMPSRTFDISALEKSINRNRRKDQLLRCNDEDARKIEALSFTSPFPNFAKVMVGSSVGGSFILEIPVEFSYNYLPTHRKEIVLRNSKGECWQVILRTYLRRTKFNAGGWASFVCQNNLKVGDICFFEFVKKWVLQVQVFKSCYRLKDSPSSSDPDDDPNNNLSVSIDSE